MKIIKTMICCYLMLTSDVGCHTEHTDYHRKVVNDLIRKQDYGITISPSLQVKYVSLRSPDPSFPDTPLVNLTTLENRDYCVAITSCGLCVVGHAHDSLEGLCNITETGPVRSQGFYVFDVSKVEGGLYQRLV